MNIAQLRAACTYLVDSTSSEEAKVVNKRMAGSRRKVTGSRWEEHRNFKVLQGHEKRTRRKPITDTPVL